MAASPDPRDRITPTAFAIAPERLGVRLATPGRRAVALGVDLLLASVVAALGGPGVAGLAAAILFFLVAMRRGSRHPFRRTVRAAFVFVGAVILFGVSFAFFEDDGGSAGYSSYGLADGLGDGAPDLSRVERQLAAIESEYGVRVDLDDAPDSLTEGDRAEAERDLRALADALAAGDTLAADSLRRTVAPVVAGAEIARLRARNEALDDRADDLDDVVDELREDLESPSILRTLRALGADFGLTLGWIGVYFTLTLAWWGGYTPGKRLLGIRVVRLDGRPLTLWNAFERFGGYAAGLATGLVGFAQVLWDPNRQGVQDKIAGTVVVRMADAHTPLRAGDA